MTRGAFRRGTLAGAAATLLAACAPAPLPDPDARNEPLRPRVVTAPVPHDADDPAIWIDPRDPARSLVLGTDKDSDGAVHAFDLQGRIVARSSRLRRPNNVDVLTGLRIGGMELDVALVSEREAGRLRILRLPDLREIDRGGIIVFAGDPVRAPMGVAGYRRPRDGAAFAIVGGKSGPPEGYLWQYRLEDDGDGAVRAVKVREFGRYSGRAEIEAIAVDARRGWVYCSDEGFGVRKYHADPDHAEAARELAVLGREGFARDHEGIALRDDGGEEGVIAVSNQQAGTIRLYAAAAGHRFLGAARISARETDGCDVSPGPLPGFPGGLFVAMSTDRTFHFYAWEELRAAARTGARGP